MNQQSTPQDDWTPCEAGALHRLARQAKSRRRLWDLSRAAGVAGLVALVLGIGFWSLGPGAGARDYNFGGIACSQVQQHMEAFAAGSLPDELAQRIRVHLEECPHCRELMKQMEGEGMVSAGLAPASRSQPAGQPTAVPSMEFADFSLGLASWNAPAP